MKWWLASHFYLVFPGTLTNLKESSGDMTLSPFRLADMASPSRIISTPLSCRKIGRNSEKEYTADDGNSDCLDYLKP